MMKVNYHTHTTYCDGTARAEELVKEAIDKGFLSLGFSGHSYLPFDDSWCMSPREAEEYKREIAALKETYKGRIEILCGVEQDILSQSQTEGYDFIIGSVHCIPKGGEYLSVDYSAQQTERNINRYYNGSFDDYAKDYFALTAQLCRKTQCDIIGHFDLVSKFNELLHIQESERYLSYAYAALESLIPYGKPFEINTGAMARGYRTTPYPSISILRMIRSLGGSIVINSDCHQYGYLDYGFDAAVSLAKKAGFFSANYLSGDRWASLPL